MTGRTLLTLAALAAAYLPSVSAAGVPFDATQLREGRFTYQISSEGQPLGKAVIEIRRQPSGDFRISLDSVDIDQHWSSQLTRGFVPLAAGLHMPDDVAPYRMDIRYSDNEVTGTEMRGGSVHPVSAVLQGQVIDQRVDWAAMMAAEFPVDGKIEFLVYDPATGSSPLSGTRTASAPITGVLGTSEITRLDYTIRKQVHPESYSVFATRESPRVMVREEMPNQLLAELIAIDE